MVDAGYSMVVLVAGYWLPATVYRLLVAVEKEKY